LRSRPFLLFVSIAIGIGAAALLIEPDLRGPELMAEERFALYTLIAAGVVAALALFIPDLRRDHVVVDRDVV
jgi:Na+/melibiose symporter-like transporter